VINGESVYFSIGEREEVKSKVLVVGLKANEALIKGRLAYR
jgi:hypothetical protein